MARCTRISIISAGGTESAPFDAACTSVAGTAEARIRSIMRGIGRSLELTSMSPKCYCRPKNHFVIPSGARDLQSLFPSLATFAHYAVQALVFLTRSRLFLQLANHPLQLSNQTVGLAANELIGQRSVIPKRTIPLSPKTFPDRFPNLAIISQNRADIV